MLGCLCPAGELFRVSYEVGDGKTTWMFYESFVQTEANRIDYSDGRLCQLSFCSTCVVGGRAFLAMQVLSFVLLLALIALLLFRIMGGVAITALAHPAHSVLIESWMALIATLLQLVAVSVWGGTCLKAVHKISEFNVTLTGFGFTITCLFFLLAQLVLLFFVRRDPRFHLGFQASSFGRGQGVSDHWVDGADEEEAAEAAEEEQIRRAARERRRSSGAIAATDAYGSYQATHPPPVTTQAVRGQY